MLLKAHRIRNQGAKQKDLHISGYISCKSFNIEYWREYNANINNQSKKPVPNGKNMGIDKTIFVLNSYLILIGIIDIGMTILCDNEGKFQIQHWPPLPINDSVAILRIVEVRIIFDTAFPQ